MSPATPSGEVDVLVVGGGPAGLAAAVALRARGATVTVVEREAAVGGVARMADHTGYGLREFRRLMRGPAYAAAWEARAEAAGVELRAATTATGWVGGDAAGLRLALTSPAGLDTVSARAVIVATGTRERPRSARLVPGSRPLGVLTTGAVQRFVARGLPVGRRALVVGAEHVSFSAVHTLHRCGCVIVALVTPEPRHQSSAVLRALTAGRHRVPVLTGTAVAGIVGRARVEAVELVDVVTGAASRVECDTVVFSGDWVPEHELARRGGLVIDPGTRGPRVDQSLRTSAPGVFAAGNLLHGAETAAVCAADGRRVAEAVGRWLADADPSRWPAARVVPVECDAPLRWVSPNAVVPGDGFPRARFLARSSVFARRLEVAAVQGGRELWRGTLRRVVPARPVHLPGGWARRLEPGAPVRLSAG